MTFDQRLATCSLVLLLVLVMATTSRADCVTVLSPDVPKGLLHSDLVFSGIVTQVDFNDRRMLFQVDRVWKGPAARAIWIYQLDSPSTDSHMIRPNPNVKYVIFANELSPEERKFRVEADERSAFGIHGVCGDGPRWSAQQERELNKITRPKKPRK